MFVGKRKGSQCFLILSLLFFPLGALKHLVFLMMYVFLVAWLSNVGPSVT